MLRSRTSLIALVVLVGGCKAEKYPELCATHVDCPPPSRCVAGLCRSACKSSLECRSELQCSGDDLQLCWPQRVERCLSGVCVPCPGGACSGVEAGRDGQEPGKEQDPELPPQEIPEPEIPEPDADALPEVADADRGADPDLEPDAEPESDPEPEQEAGPGPLGTCDPASSNCPQGLDCVRLVNLIDFPPECQDAVEDGTFDGNCFACRPVCTSSDQCASHENCLQTSGTQETCVTLFCDAWNDFTPARRGAAARLTEIDADSGQERVYTLDRVDVIHGDVTVAFTASSLCFPVGTQGADFEISLNVFVELPEINAVSVYDLGQASGAHITARDADWCTDRWNATLGKVEVLMLDTGDTVLRMSGVYLTREPGGCFGVEERYFPRIIIDMGPGGRQTEGSSCSYPQSSFCRDGQVCAPYTNGKCYPFCDAGSTTALKIGCDDGEQCVDPGSGIGLLDGGVCN